MFGKLFRKLINSRRRYYDRLRKPLKVEVPGPERIIHKDGKEQVFIEKDVPRIVDHIVLIPRRGIRDPISRAVNRLTAVARPKT
jgi:hypothetical protein